MVLGISKAEWNRLQTQEFNYLDELDLKPFLKSGVSVRSIMDILERMFQADYCSKTGDEYLFNVINEYDFEQYLKKRYNINTYEYSELRIR